MEQFGKYQVLRKIGAGGFGVVYEGYDPAIRRRVAIKTCTSVDAKVRLRFAREAEITGNLSHPNIVVVYDYGEVDGSPYLVQEFLVGEDLDAKIDRREPIALAQKLSWLIQIADALSHAHRQGVVHRDVKPSNVRVLDTGVVKVMDFGIAWIKNDVSLTATGRTVGTAAYMAPEQLRNEPVGPQADVFAFGVLAYELLTGERAFAGDSPSQILYQVLNVEPLPIRSRSPEVPAELAALIAGCHRKDPEERYRNLDGLIPALRHLELQAGGPDPTGVPRVQPPPPPPSARNAEESRAPAASASSRSVSRTVPLRPPALPSASNVPQPPPPPGPAARARLDSIELRGRAPRTRATLAGVAIAKRASPASRLPLLAALVGVALLLAAIARWQTVEPLLFAMLPRGDSGANGPPADGTATAAPMPSTAPTPRATSAPAATPLPATSPSSPPPPSPPPEEQTSPPSSVAAALDPPTVLPEEPAAAPTPQAATTRRAPRALAPAALSVRAALGAPQGWAWLDDRPLGRTPIRRATLAPGEHRVRVSLDPDGLRGAATWEVRVARGQELILTVDPASGSPPREARRALVAP